MEVAVEISEAIELAIRAGACRKAARIDPENAASWQGATEDESRRVCSALAKFAVERQAQ